MDHIVHRQHQLDLVRNGTPDIVPITNIDVHVVGVVLLGVGIVKDWLSRARYFNLNDKSSFSRSIIFLKKVCLNFDHRQMK